MTSSFHIEVHIITPLITPFIPPINQPWQKKKNGKIFENE